MLIIAKIFTLSKRAVITFEKYPNLKNLNLGNITFTFFQSKLFQSIINIFMILLKKIFNLKSKYGTVKRVEGKYQNTQPNYICTTSYYFQCVLENDSRLRSINAGL